MCVLPSPMSSMVCWRKAGAPSHFWGQVDAAADIAFTSLSLAAAAWFGYVGPWVPAGGGCPGWRFLLRNLGQQPTPHGRLVEDRAGKAAGVIYYLLVGAIALELAVTGTAAAGGLLGRGTGCSSTRCSCSCVGGRSGLVYPLPEQEVAVGLGQKEHTEGPIRQHERQVRHQTVGQQVGLRGIAAEEKDPARLRGAEMGHRDEARPTGRSREEGHKTHQGNLDPKKAAPDYARAVRGKTRTL